MITRAELYRARSLVIDMDGVLYRGDAPVEGAGEFLDFLRQTDHPFVLLTNNSTLTAAQYVAKLARMGMEVEEHCILTSAEATAVYLAQTALPGAQVFAIGEDGVRTELEKRGFELRDDADVTYVVVGMDRGVTYAKLATATLAIRGGAKFIGTNPDRTFPGNLGLLPGNGAILAALQAATDTAPQVIGKPQPAIFELALQKLGADPQTSAMIGDRLDTDVLGAQQLGLMTVLVLSGVTDAQLLARSTVVPDKVYEDIAAFYRAWRDAVATRD